MRGSLALALLSIYVNGEAKRLQRSLGLFSTAEAATTRLALPSGDVVGRIGPLAGKFVVRYPENGF